jgi:hypothetical protein
MKECLHCKKEFEAKTDKRKFCSDSCRVMHHRKHGGKNSLKPFQVQAMYNEMMEAIAQLRGGGLPVKGETPPAPTRQEATPPQKEQKTFQQFMNQIPELLYEDEFKAFAREVNAATHLSEKQRSLLIMNMKQSNL